MLNRLFGSSFSVAPFSVVVDPTREIGQLNELVAYLYRQQLAEADIIVVSKADLFANAVSWFKGHYSGVVSERALFGASAHTGEGIEAWLNAVLNTENADHANLALDYQKYADAEAALGWLNFSADWHVHEAISLMEIGKPLLTQIQNRLLEAGLIAAHVKLMLNSDSARLKGAFTNDRGAFVWETRNDAIKSSTGRFILNARVEGTPDELSRVAEEAVAAVEVGLPINISVRQWDCFSPKPPNPTHRLDSRGLSVPLDELGDARGLR